MGIFQAIYKYFRNNRLFFILSIAVVSILAVYLDTRIVLEEDISRSFIGENEKTSAILRNSQFVNKIILNIFSVDSLNPPDPDKLTAFADELTDSLKKSNFARHLSRSVFTLMTALLQKPSI